jgi:hypothetical protein
MLSCSEIQIGYLMNGRFVLKIQVPISSLASSSSPSFPNVQQSTKHTQREERLLIFDPIKCNYFLGGGKKLYTGI